MPSKSRAQQKMIFARRGMYKTKSNTPEKWKWIWDKGYEKLEAGAPEKITESKLDKYLSKLYNEASKDSDSYNTKKIENALKILSIYGSPSSIKQIMMARTFVNDFDAHDAKEVLDALAVELKKGASIHSGYGGYSYTPISKELTSWRPSDGGKVSGKLLDIMVRYLFANADEAADWLTMEPDYAVEELLTFAKDQEEYESERIRGERFLSEKQLKKYAKLKTK